MNFAEVFGVQDPESHVCISNHVEWNFCRNLCEVLEIIQIGCDRVASPRYI